ncbi:flagellar basal body rod protein FlgC [candidate division WOR-1 bacterium RIFCSPLOWO2_02_FULL_46_20]|uniref:Flagellar basal-body rod protein FlgC n=2 Tax=Saganbacteria TaxID=1703751 RepID=A0A1F4RFK2_UNCSA|nr:MAG: flagellar basal body rod protein FlgC [candidate division WOR-1 bacterium RIFCSPHIGHO2_02_FULL_45_12]OGC06263.1 MAG: flagellar basal body rod protein FlgC [candidate division WOR-1 bacterium RIFCSPLOWO2_02_FULL_46_20]OGC08630.1 MAG: flagellar basal body rod protein FlgC [candidate division WOR-1 bacterium RIFCSPLOWO2_12_FULL_45_9]
MGLHQAMAISVSGIKAENIAMELIASNLANIGTTNTINGGPYRRRLAILSDKPLSFADELARAEHKLFEGEGGVEVVDVIEDTSPFQKVYNPGHPDADAQGFVSMPNISLSKEMADMVYVSKLYEANITAYKATMKMMQDTLQLQ